MIRHGILIGSAYSIGKRIALDYYEEADSKSSKELEDKMSHVIETCGDDISLSIHFIQTKTKKWSDVVDYDEFFKSIKLIEKEEEFIREIMKDRDLKGIDIGKYILAKVPCTHLKLEKLVYMCYADYLCRKKEKLFVDIIYAYKFGPVVKSVYEEFKRSGQDILEDRKSRKKYDKTAKMLPIRSRIIASKDGAIKISVVDDTLEKYGKLTAIELMKLTHKDSTPWEKSGAGKCINKRITDDMIYEYHKCEDIAKCY